MKKKTIKRVLLSAIAVVMLLCVLTACGGTTATVTPDSISTPLENTNSENARYMAQLLMTNTATLEKFVAASRGYNMFDPNFNDKDLNGDGQDDGELPAPDLGTVHVEAAKSALALVQPTEQSKKDNYFMPVYQNLNAEMVLMTVEAVGSYTTVDLTEPNNPMVWIGQFLGLLTKITGGYYVLALFIFAIIVEIVLLYFSIKQQKNSIKQARMSPKERAIRKKYAGRNDQVSMRKMQEEIQRLYQEEGFNPMGGCLPLLIQMPVLIMLYNIVIDPLYYVLGKAEALSSALTTYATTARAAGGLGITIGNGGKSSIELLSNLNGDKLTGLGQFSYFSNAQDCASALNGIQLPKFTMFGLNVGATPSFTPENKTYLWLILIPVLTFAAYFFSMKINRKLMYQPATDAMTSQQMGCSNNMMDITMPLMSVWIAFVTPAAIGIYWIFKCLIGVGKQFIIHKAMPLPTFTEEDYKQAEKEMKAKSKGQRLHTVVQDARGQQYRSLHHIDDEDDLPPRENVQRSAVYVDDEDEAPVAESKPENKMAAPLKEDRKNDSK